MLQCPLFRAGHSATKGEKSGGSLGKLGRAAPQHTTQAFVGKHLACTDHGLRRLRHSCTDLRNPPSLNKSLGMSQKDMRPCRNA